MAKFNFNNIRNNASGKDESLEDNRKLDGVFDDNNVTPETEKVSINVGAGLLTEASKDAAVDLGNVTYVQRGQLFENAENFYSIDGIEDLKESIAACGLLQPLLLKETERGFLVLGGHRRLAAIDSLISEGRWNREIPGILQNLQKPVIINGRELDEAQKETYLLVTQNKTSRKYTAADTAKEIKVLRELFSGSDEDEIRDDEDPVHDAALKPQAAKPKRRPKGTGRTRTQIAKELGISEGKIGQHDFVEKHGTEELKAVMQQGNVSAPVAAKIARLDDDSQRELIESAEGGEIKASDVRQFMEGQIDVSSNTIDKARLMFDLKDVIELLKFPVTLDDVGLQSYKDCIELLRMTLNGEK